MKKIFFILLLLPFLSKAQILVPRSGSAVTVQDYHLQVAGSFKIPVFADSARANLKKGLDSLGEIWNQVGTKYVFIRDTNSFGTHKWDTLGGTGTGGGGTSYTADETTLHLTGTIFSIKSTYPGQTSVVTVGNLITGSLASGFTPVADPQIASSGTWNAKLTSTLNSAQIFVGNGSNVATAVSMSGDATLANTGALTFASVVAGGSCTNCNLTVNNKGLVTSVASGSGGGSGTPFPDNSALIENNSDHTKLIIISASGITTGTTRTLTSPDANGTITLDGNTSTLTNKTIAAASNTVTGLTNTNLSGTAAISNANLANSAVTVNGVSISLGSSGNVTDANLSTSNVTTNNATTSKHGFLSILPNDATQFANGVGGWSVPPGIGITSLTGDGTATGPGAVAFTLATVNSNVGTFGDATHVMQQTVNAKGLTTAASNVSIQIAESQVTNLTSDLALKAPIASPTFTGVPSAPTATAGTNTTQIATTAFVQAAIDTTSLYATQRFVTASIQPIETFTLFSPGVAAPVPVTTAGVIVPYITRILRDSSYNTFIGTAYGSFSATVDGATVGDTLEIQALNSNDNSYLFGGKAVVTNSFIVGATGGKVLILILSW